MNRETPDRREKRVGVGLTTFFSLVLPDLLIRMADAVGAALVPQRSFHSVHRIAWIGVPKSISNRFWPGISRRRGSSPSW
ncbi:MAG: hypothetical protein RLY70_3318 [Planctomycetota bacterium]